MHRVKRLLYQLRDCFLDFDRVQPFTPINVSEPISFASNQSERFLAGLGALTAIPNHLRALPS